MDLSPQTSTLATVSKRTTSCLGDGSRECEVPFGLLHGRRIEELECRANGSEDAPGLNSMNTDVGLPSPCKESTRSKESTCFHSETATEAPTSSLILVEASGNDNSVADVDSEKQIDNLRSVISASSAAAHVTDRGLRRSSLSNRTSSSVVILTKGVSSEARFAPTTPGGAGHVNLCAQDGLYQGDEICVFHEHNAKDRECRNDIHGKVNSSAERHRVRGKEKELQEERKCASSDDHGEGLGVVRTSNVDLMPWQRRGSVQVPTNKSVHSKCTHALNIW